MSSKQGVSLNEEQYFINKEWHCECVSANLNFLREAISLNYSQRAVFHGGCVTSN